MRNFNSEEEGVGYEDEDGVGLIKCPKCKRENWAMAVSSGQCCWCGYDVNKLKDTK